MKIFFHPLLWFICFFIHSTHAIEISRDLSTWANENPVASVAIDSDIPPFDYLDDSGQPTGIGAVIRRQLSQVLPIDLSVTSKGSFAQQMDKLAEQQVDLLSICAETTDRHEKMLFSKPFLTLTPVFIASKEDGLSHIDELRRHARIGVPKKYASMSTAKQLTREDNIVEVESTLLGLQMVSDGRLDGMVSYLSVKNYFMRNDAFNDLMVLPLEHAQTTRIGFCVAKDKPQLVELLNLGIEQLGLHYFSRVQSEWLSSLDNETRNSLYDTTAVPKTAVLLAVAMLFLLLLTYRYTQRIAEKFATLRFKVSYFSTLLLAFLSTFLVLEYYLSNFKERLIEEQKDSFEITKAITEKALDDWYHPHLEMIKEIVKLPGVMLNIKLLSSEHSLSDEPLNDRPARWLSQFFESKKHLTEHGREFEIIAPNERLLLSSAPGSTQHVLIKQFYPQRLAQALNGQTTFIPPIKGAHSATAYASIIEPLIDYQGNVVALLIANFAAANDFSLLFNYVRLGSAVESYAIDHRGYLLSESPFIDQLHREGTIPFGQSAILVMNVAHGEDSPLVQDARFKTSGRNLSGYQDYMGYTVAGQWNWLEKYHLMLVSEISLEEMYLEYNEQRDIIYSLMLLSMFLVAVSSLFMMMISHRANKISMLSQEKLEQLVAQRTLALQSAEQRNSLVVDSVADGILGLDSEGRVLFINKAAQDLLGCAENEALSQSYLHVIYQDCDASRAQSGQKRRILASLKNEENLYVAHDTFIHVDGIEVPVTFSLSVIRDANSPFSAVLTFQDISLRLLDSEKTRALVTTLPTAVLLVNMQREVVEINNATESLLGYTKEYILGKNLAYFVPENRQSEHEKILDTFFANPKSMRIGDDSALTVLTKTERVIEVSVIFSMLELNNEPILALSVHDVTDANQAKRMLIEAKELSDEASRSKSEFLANMSHEIRTPMNAIIGMSMLALKGELAAKQRNYVTKVHSAATNLLGIINDLLDFSKIEANKMELENKPFALAELLDNFSTMIAMQAQEKGVNLLFNVDHDVPLFFMGDQLRLNQILINLGGNAIKFTEQGEVILNISTLKTEGERIKLQFSVQDSGIGIKEEHQEKLFSRFAQADTSTTRKYGGTGLGLSICQRLVQLMGGDIWIESTFGEGSEFFFSIWLTLEKQHKSLQVMEIAQTRLTGKRVLIVDDNLMTLAGLSEVAEGFGCEVYSAISGKQALSFAEQHKEFDFALVDWDMPDMNGVETLEALNNLQGVIIRHPILISAYSKDLIKEQGYLQQAQTFLAKPITAQQLQQQFQQLLGYEMDQDIAALNTTQTQDELSGTRLLLVEDNELNQELAITLLEDKGIVVSVANHGKEAVQLAEQNHYDVILMDIQMPIMDGYQATRLIREFNEQIPILAMTANATEGVKERVLAAGMNDHISKPVYAKKMFKMIKHWLNISSKSERADSVVSEKNSQLGALMRLDVASGLAICNDNMQLYRNMLSQFEEKNNFFYQKFMSHLTDGDVQGQTRLVHTLKGSAGNIGANILYQQLDELERTCAQPMKQQQWQALLDKVINELALVNQAIAAQLAQVTVPSVVKVPLSLTGMEITSTLNELQQLVDEFDTQAQSVAERLLEGVLEPQQKVWLQQFIAQLQRFDFEAAQQILSEFKRDHLDREKRCSKKR